ncbi:phosphatase [Clostridium septicum]|uniref:Phosphatase n=1 Tax=Clostridium septicum TaxID=1504 RepID=A0A9N7PL74_CLOSE|nr:phosphatase [Clostridium septicum]AYE35097.1 phosphatase [Clostridium septicum]MDU1312688.1 phosphatase [Clostridium septicum]QAS60490.1 phosphatase [Clostridium septicum]UEC20252.1 phosphatase [Clostridium septicum]USS01695.1 phosphatase [Clostridium septicum]
MKAIIDLHCHTISSGHAYSTIKENIEGAIENGIKILGVSDHGPEMPGGPYIFHFGNLRVLRENINGVRMLKGVEANIIDYNGNIDIPEDVLEGLDYVIASLHPPCIPFGSIDENTRAVIKAIENKYVKIIAHPDDNRYPLNYEEIVKVAKKNNVLLEVNNSSLKADSYRPGALENYKTMLNLCRENKVKIILGSDAHIWYDVGRFDNCERLIKEVGFPEELVVNYNEKDLKELGLY